MYVNNYIINYGQNTMNTQQNFEMASNSAPFPSVSRLELNAKGPRESIRIFKSPLLETFTHVHPITPLLLWSPVVALLVWRSWLTYQMGIFQIAGLMFSGLLCWSLLEYLLHRFVFHFQARGPIEERIQFILHGLHHADPSDPTRLVMPPIVSIALALIFYSVFRVLLGRVFVYPFFSAFVVGYLSYDYIHFSIHHFKPRTRIGKFLKKNHMLHHYHPKGARYGVSSPLWDSIFRSGS